MSAQQSILFEGPAAPGVTLYTDRRRLPFIVDADDVEAVSRYVWSIDGGGYPITSIGKGVKAEGRRPRSLRLHQFLLGPAPDGLQWDHANRIKADNRRSNLSAVTSVQNNRNYGARGNSKSGVRGVYPAGATGRWYVQIVTHGDVRTCGTFDTIAEAVAARVAAEKELWS